jgi:hypothetical protein
LRREKREAVGRVEVSGEKVRHSVESPGNVREGKVTVQGRLEQMDVASDGVKKGIAALAGM